VNSGPEMFNAKCMKPLRLVFEDEMIVLVHVH